MSKYYLAPIVALGLVLSPAVGLAQNADKANSEGSGHKMKGPPNADGYKGQQGSGGSKDENGAAAAKATGEDKK